VPIKPNKILWRLDKLVILINKGSCIDSAYFYAHAENHTDFLLLSMLNYLQEQRRTNFKYVVRGWCRCWQPNLSSNFSLHFNYWCTNLEGLKLELTLDCQHQHQPLTPNLKSTNAVVHVIIFLLAAQLLYELKFLWVLFSWILRVITRENDHFNVVYL